MSTEYATFLKSNTMSAFFAGQGEILKKKIIKNSPNSQAFKI
jgi:hypothetical protein